MFKSNSNYDKPDNLDALGGLFSNTNNKFDVNALDDELLNN